jgi:hypothetical protein
MRTSRDRRWLDAGFSTACAARHKTGQFKAIAFG